MVAYYRFLLRDESRAQPSPPPGVAANSLTWVLPPFEAGIGGHLNALRFISMLVERGYDCRVVIDVGSWFGTAADVSARLARFYGRIDAPVYVGVDTAPPAYAVVATGWEQAYTSGGCAAHKRFYFVQDFEPWFYPRGSEYVFAEQTYGMGLVGITAGSWLSSKLEAEYGMSCHPLGFSYDKALYTPVQGAATPTKRVFFYARPSTQRRAFELGILALHRLCSRMPDVEVVLAGSDLARELIPFKHRVLGQLAVRELRNVYVSCDLALILSMSNLSLLPLELMACGTPVVSNTGPWAEWLLNPANAVLADAEVAALSDAMESLLRDEARRLSLRDAGLLFAQSTSWQREGQAMAAILASYGCHAARAPDRVDGRDALVARTEVN
ncbi:MAG TPA: glycosyltransferase family 4 protein [Caldimonas sp.]|nr:glycosyltransferase family 4 protein [Caldimonas sp.]HEX2542200.1 glycosyltransferase family 4 protein [Caldimonas sp.]